MTHCLTEVGTEDDGVQVGVEGEALPREGSEEELIRKLSWFLYQDSMALQEVYCILSYCGMSNKQCTMQLDSKKEYVRDIQVKQTT